MTTELLGGIFVDDAALAFALRLEFAGHALSVDHGQLLVSQASKLTAEDRAQIRRQRWQLLAIASYQAP